MHPFTIGQEYERSQLLEFVGSKQAQTGVIWGKKEPGCLIVTSGGRHGKKVGYSDQPLENGCWWYFGQGQRGDHAPANAANAKLIAAQQSILLFTTREPTAREVRQRGNYKKLFEFQGLFNVSDYDVIVPEAGARNKDRLLRFLLVPSDSEGLLLDNSPSTSPPDILLLREEILAQMRPNAAPKGVALAEYRRRNGKIRRYAVLRAQGKCEACGCPAPFLDDQGNGFLEVHHILRLADDGIDAPQNVAAICPNCHRRAHHSVDRADFRQQLLSAAHRAETKLAIDIN